MEADLELVVEPVVDAAAEAVGLEAGLQLVVELAVRDVVDQDVVEAIFEVVAAKEVAVGTAHELVAALEAAAVEFEAADEELDLVTVGTEEEVAAAEAEHFLFHVTIVGVAGAVKVAESVGAVEVLVLGPVDDVG